MEKKQSKNKIRNLAIVAHIDHGKTTLVDCLLKESNIFRENQQVQTCVMDSFDQERERGITIYAKHTALFFGDCKINIIDTPGHADFSAEVERILGMVSSVLLLVDAQEGPMPQTRFVLSKSLKMGLKPIVVINKIDKPYASPDKALDKTFDLFTELGATDEQLDFAYCYASGVNGFAIRNIDDPRENMRPLFELIVEKVPVPEGNIEDPFLLQIATVSYDDYVGRKVCGRVRSGSLKKGDSIVLVDHNDNKLTRVVSKIEGHEGLKQIELPEASCGDIVLLSGIQEGNIGDTVCSPLNIVKLPSIYLDEPTVSIDIMVNTSPFAGRSGKHVTMNKIRERLLREKRANVSLRIVFSEDQETITVCGRGELHLAVLIESLRREGFELGISKPRVIFKEVDGVHCEPIEEVTIEIPDEHTGAVIEDLSIRKAEMLNLETSPEGITTMQFLVPTRGLMGYRNTFLTNTRGNGILTSVFHSYQPHKGAIAGRKNGVMIAMASGKATPYAAFALQERGTLFLSPPIEVYEGMIVGQHARDNDLVVNITKEKQLTNIRASGTDENIILSPPRVFILERAIDYIEDDELVEVTPDAIRMRKRYLKENDRKRDKKN